MDNLNTHNNYKNILHSEIIMFPIRLSQRFSKISYYCHVLDKLITLDNRYLTPKIIDRLDRFDLFSYSTYKIIEYLDPFVTCPSYIQLYYLKQKLIKLLILFFKY